MAVGGALFGGGGRAPASKALVEFRAGKMTLNPGTNLVTADKRKGLVLVDQGNDQLMHFKWKDRTTGTIEDDLIILPDDVEFKRVPQCTTGRVFILKFKGAGAKKMFFWMQEPKEDKDEEFCKKVNDLLNNGPPLPGSGRSGGSSLMLGNSGLSLSNLGDTELQHLLNNMNQQQLMQIFGGSADGGGMSGLAALLGSGQGTPTSSRQRGSRSNRDPASSAAASAQPSAAATSASTPSASAVAATPARTGGSAATPAAPRGERTRASAAAAASAAPIQLSDLQNILSGIQVPPEAQAKAGPSVDLSSGLTAEAMQPLLGNPDFVKRMKELLPSEHQASNIEDEIKGTVQSPQFQQALGLFSTAFQSGQLAPLIREFALGDEAVEAAANGDLEAFVKALQKNAPKEEKTDEPEDMALD